MDSIRGKKYFTKMDVRWGYNNVRIKQGDEWKAAFKTKYGLFEPTVMFFGLCNSPATFQSMMDHIFAEEIDLGTVIIYMDDILIPADSLEELERVTKIVLQKLQENDLYLKPEKCEFAKEQVEYLGMVISENQISMDQKKLLGIKEWPEPTTVKETRSFLGFGNYYRRFIMKYSEIVKPLNDLLKKDQKFQWNQEAQRAFDTLKQWFTEEPVLMMPDPTKPFQIESDASKFAFGAVLTQLDTNGARHPVAFLSKTFTPTERRYKIYDRELMGIVRALEEWRHYIQGSPFVTEVLSDHRNLTYFRKPQRLNDRQARWSLILSAYDIKLIHIPGNKMIQSDALSRRPDHNPGEEDENKGPQVMLNRDLFIKSIDLELQQRIAECEVFDEDVTRALEQIKNSSISNLSEGLQDWTIEEAGNVKAVFYKGRQYIPDNLEVRREIIRKFHDHPTAGHPGELETYMQVKEEYWWPGMRTFVKNYVKGCGACQQFKINRRPTKPTLQPIPGAETPEPFKQVSMDFITNLPEINGFNSILSVVDHGLTKGVILIPTRKSISAEETGQLLLDNLYKRFGLPDKIISDRGPQFAAKAHKEFLKLLDIEPSLSTAFHPQSDGTTERYNQEIETYISIYCIQNPETWLKRLSTLEFVHNRRRHSDRTSSSFELIYGYQPRAIPLSFRNTNFPTVLERTEKLRVDQLEATSAHELARNRMQARINGKLPKFKKGEKVWLEATNLNLPYHKKISTKREGPFEIKEVMGPVTYKLKLPPRWLIHNVFHATLLSPFRETEANGPISTNSTPTEIDQDGTELFEVEAIVAHRKYGGVNNPRYKYFVKWKGGTDNPWETAGQFRYAQEILAAYKKKHKLR